jgi:hypothetical protein
MILSYIRDARTGRSFLVLLLRNQIFPRNKVLTKAREHISVLTRPPVMREVQR